MTCIAVNCFNRFDGLDAFIAVDGFVPASLQEVDQGFVYLRVI